MPKLTNTFWSCIAATLLISGILLAAVSGPVWSQESTQAQTGKTDAAPAPLEDSEGTVLPLRYEPPARPFITIQIQINDSEPLTVQVDTGSTVGLILAPWVPQKLGLKATGKIRSLGQNGPMASFYEGGKVRFRPLTGSKTLAVNTPEVVVADLSLFKNYLGPKIAGILGGDYFKLFLSRFDFDRKTLTFFPTNHAPIKPAPEAAVLPLALPEQNFRGMLTLPLTSEVSLKCVLDTGSDAVVLPASALQSISPLALGPTGMVSNVRGQFPTQNALLENLSLGTVSVPLVPVVTREGITDGLLGLSVLSRFRVTIDPTHKQLLLEPRKLFPLVWRADTGVRLHSDDNKIFIGRVISAEGAKQGLRVKDEVTSIDGQKLEDLPYHQIVNLLDGDAGTWLTLTTTKANGTQATARLLRRSQFPHIFPSDFGLIVAMSKDKTWHILWIQNGSQADQAGLQTGDQLLLINDKKVRNLSPEKIEELLAVADPDASPLKALVFKQQKTGQQVTLTRP